MKRLLTLASSGLFVTGLAILPLSVHAQSTNVDAKTAPTASAPANISGPAGASVATPAPAATQTTGRDAKDASKDTKVMGSKAGTAPASATQSAGSKTTTVPAPTTPPAGAAKTGG